MVLLKIFSVYLVSSLCVGLEPNVAKYNNLYRLNYYNRKPVSHYQSYLPLRKYHYTDYYSESQYLPRTTKILYTIARNDKLGCIPRLLCEALSNTASRNGSPLLTGLPVNVDLESVISILSKINGEAEYPISFFARAALLGFASTGNSNSCHDAYPQCPQDPNKLVGYLNNYNGGFFRLFSGVNNPPPDIEMRYPTNIRAQQRILNQPIDIIDEKLVNKHSKKILVFPKDDSNNKINDIRELKRFPYIINEYYIRLGLDQPSANYKAAAFIFPDRTGTGELILDAEQLNENDHHSQNKPENNNPIRFISQSTNKDMTEPIYNILENHQYGKALFRFPL